MNETDLSQTKLSLSKAKQSKAKLTTTTHPPPLFPSFLHSFMWPNWSLWASIYRDVSPSHNLSPLNGKWHQTLKWCKTSEQASEKKSTRCEELNAHRVENVSLAHITSERVHIKYSRFKSCFHFKIPSPQCVNHLLNFASFFSPYSVTWFRCMCLGCAHKHTHTVFNIWFSLFRENVLRSIAVVCKQTLAVFHVRSATCTLSTTTMETFR